MLIEHTVQLEMGNLARSVYKLPSDFISQYRLGILEWMETDST